MGSVQMFFAMLKQRDSLVRLLFIHAAIEIQAPNNCTIALLRLCNPSY